MYIHSTETYRKHLKTSQKHTRAVSIKSQFERSTHLNSQEKPITESIFPEGTTELILNPQLVNK